MAMAVDDFQTPLGVAKVDQELAKSIRKNLVDVDPEAHQFEHSIEVQLPFLQHISSDFKFVPVCMGFQDFEAARGLGEILRDAVKGRDVVVIASTDMSHYVSAGTAKAKDWKALKMVEAMDPEGLYSTVRDENISMCGCGPVIATMVACGSGKAKVLKYATSGDVRPMTDVVGYASVVIEK